MSNRGSTSAFQTEIVKDSTQNCHLIEIYMDDTTYYLTDYFSSITFGSNTYTALGYFLGFDSVEENVSITANQLTMSLSGVSQEFTSLFLTEDYVNRKVIIRSGFLNTSNALIADPIIIFQGRMNNPTITENADSGMATVSVSIANQFIDFENVPGRYTNHENQQLHYPGDRGFEYASEIIKDVVWGSEFDSGNRVSGAGSLTGVLTGSSVIDVKDIGINPIIIINPFGGVFSIDLSNYEDKIIVNVADHGLVDGSTVDIDGAVGITGVDAVDLNQSHTVEIIDPDRYEFELDTSEVGTNLIDFFGEKSTTINDVVPVTVTVITETTTNKENYVTVIDNSEEAEVGDLIQIKDSGDVGGIPEDKLTEEPFQVKEILSLNGTKLVKIAVTEKVEIKAPPVSTDTNVANTVTYNFADHEYNVGDTFVVAGSAAVGGVAANSINGTKTVASIKNNNAVNVTVTDSVSSTVTHGGGDNVTVDGAAPKTPSICTTSGSTTLSFYQIAHGLAANDEVSIYGSSSVGGVPSTYINKIFTVASVPNANTFTVTSGFAATSTVCGGGAYTFAEIPVKATSVARGGKSITTISSRVTRPDGPFNRPFDL